MSEATVIIKREMENKDTASLNPNVNIRIPIQEAGSATLEIVDNLEVTDTFKKQYLIPYLSSLWESLANRTWHPEQGLHRFTLVEVRLCFFFLQFMNFQNNPPQ